MSRLHWIKKIRLRGALLALTLLGAPVLFACGQPNPENPGGADSASVSAGADVVVEEPTVISSNETTKAIGAPKAPVKSVTKPKAYSRRVVDLKTLTIAPEKIDVNMAEVVIVINKAAKGRTAQTLRLYKKGKLQFDIRVSTGREKLEHTRPNEHFKDGRTYWSHTPVGYFRVQRLDREYVSRTWGSVMPNAVFFYDGATAIHAASLRGIKAVAYLFKPLGKRGSGGCIRAKKKRSERIYELVESTLKDKVLKIDADGAPAVHPETGKPYYTKGYDSVIVIHDTEDGADIPKDLDELDDEDSSA